MSSIKDKIAKWLAPDTVAKATLYDAGRINRDRLVGELKAEAEVSQAIIKGYAKDLGGTLDRLTTLTAALKVALPYVREAAADAEEGVVKTRVKSQRAAAEAVAAAVRADAEQVTRASKG